MPSSGRSPICEKEKETANVKKEKANDTNYVRGGAARPVNVDRKDFEE
jgi:hypothetical protein